MFIVFGLNVLVFALNGLGCHSLGESLCESLDESLGDSSPRIRWVEF